MLAEADAEDASADATDGYSTDSSWMEEAASDALLEQGAASDVAAPEGSVAALGVSFVEAQLREFSQD